MVILILHSYYLLNLNFIFRKENVMTTYEKLYAVTFNQYTNSSMDTVQRKFKDEDGTIKGGAYLNVPKEGLIITEKSIGKITEYGNGIRDLHYVGKLVTDDELQAGIDRGEV
jgi:hypothetical protein